MESLARRLVVVVFAVGSIAGCGVRTPLDLSRDGSVAPPTDGSFDAGTGRDGGGVSCRADFECEDRLECNGRERCVSGRCIGGPPVACADRIECTVEECVEGRGCVSTPDDSLCPGGSRCDPAIGCVGLPCMTDGDCADGRACNGVERCGPDNTCRPGEPPRCDDDIDCSIDSCVEPGGTCSHIPDGARCPSGACDLMLGCVGAMCAGSFDCDDGRVCNGAEICAGGTCRPGVPLGCDDGIACTVDACSDGFGGCSSTPDSSRCPAGQLCDPGAGCVVRACTPDGSCDDGLFCNGLEVCDAATGMCRPTAPPSCDDGRACTIDRCIEAFGCVSEPRSPRETCGNRVDDDCDGLVDCADDDCRGAPGCPVCTPFESECFDGRDDDCDGRFDCDDPDCAMACAPMSETNCGNGIDDDGDGFVDCADFDCRFDPRCRDAGGSPVDAGPPRDSGPPPPGEIGIAACTNGVDDDGDGRIDCRDPDCSPFGPMGECCNGVDDDGDGNADLFTCRCYDNSTCVGVGDLDQVCWATSFSVCAPRCNFYGGDAFCTMLVPDLPRCNATTGECVR